MSSYLSKKKKQFVKARAKGYCEYCIVSSSFSSDFFPTEHIIPESKGGSSDLDNLAFSCSICNGHKYNKTHHYDPITNLKVPLFHPRKDQWKAHFQWNDDETLLIGLTPTGRATIDLMDINRDSNINLRSLLTVFGIHPPKEYS